MPIGQAERLPNFVGGSYQGAVSMIDCEYAVNLYPQFGVKGANVKNALLPRPGLSLFAWLPGAPVRAIFWQDGRGFAVSGNFFCEFFQSGGFTVWGTVAAGFGTTPRSARMATTGCRSSSSPVATATSSRWIRTR